MIIIKYGLVKYILCLEYLIFKTLILHNTRVISALKTIKFP